jgi:energy-converting hydrogenase A subunit R
VKPVFITDCEGPISKNDNAFEIASKFIPSGDKLFSIVSRYDDVISDVLKRPGYRAGDTVKLILPFLKAYDVTDCDIKEFSAEHLLLIAKAKEALRYIRKAAKVFIISTSYEHYIKAMCEAISFSCNDVYCTRFSLDKYDISDIEKKQLRELASIIVQMRMFEIPPNAESLLVFTPEVREYIERLDGIFAEEITNMKIGRIYSEVNTMGGAQKAEAVQDAVERASSNLMNAMYVGDSITDGEAFKLVKHNSGLAVSFNGNRYAIENSDLVVLSENCLATGVIADTFCKRGKEAAFNLVRNWDRTRLVASQVDPELLACFFRAFPKELPKVEIITEKNKETLIQQSEQFRKTVRGEAVGSLG